MDSQAVSIFLFWQPAEFCCNTFDVVSFRGTGAAVWQKDELSLPACSTTMSPYPSSGPERLTCASLCWLSASPGEISASLASWMRSAEPSITSRAESSIAAAALGSMVEAATPRAACARVFRAWAVSLAAIPTHGISVMRIFFKSQLLLFLTFYRLNHESWK